MSHSTDSGPVTIPRSDGRKRVLSDEIEERRYFDEINDMDGDAQIAEMHKRRRFQEPTPELAEEDARFYEPELARLLQHQQQHHNGDNQCQKKSQPGPPTQQGREKPSCDDGAKVQVKIGYVATCEKCANHVPGHYMHIIQRKSGN